jgi:hypothetical protein
MLESFKNIFTYNFMDLTLGFKYPGHFIIAQKLTFEDWRWLLKKFDKRIKHWYNHWLTLGGLLYLSQGGIGISGGILDGNCGSSYLYSNKNSAADL